MTDLGNCGTRAGYQAHLDARRHPGEAVLCLACSGANAEASAARRADPTLGGDLTSSKPGPGLYTVLHPTQHGTDAGYRKHVRRVLGWTPVACDACKDAHAAAARAYRRSAKECDGQMAAEFYDAARATVADIKATAATAPKRALKPCGTDAAYRRHRRAGETCYSCMEAHNATVAARRAAAR